MRSAMILMLLAIAATSAAAVEEPPPGRIVGTAFRPTGEHPPFAKVYGYLCWDEDGEGINPAGPSEYIAKFMTDASGRFRHDRCPPGQCVLRLTESAHGYQAYNPAVWVRVASGKTSNLRLFAPEPDDRLVPVRTLHGERGFRFIGLAPGEYTLRFEYQGCEPQVVSPVIVENGKATWLDKVVLTPVGRNCRTQVVSQAELGGTP